jgi:hypothetical protein
MPKHAQTATPSGSLRVSQAVLVAPLDGVASSKGTNASSAAAVSAHSGTTAGVASARAAFLNRTIEKQRRRAVELWTARMPQVSAECNACILSELNSGIISPVYHALVRGCDPFGCVTSIPSGNTVVAGDVLATSSGAAL